MSRTQTNARTLPPVVYMLACTSLIVLVAGFAQLAATMRAAPAAPAAAPAVWQHFKVGDAIAADGRSALAHAADEMEAQGYEVRFVAVHQNADGSFGYDLVGRTPAPAPAASAPVTTTTPSPYGTSCLGYPTPPFPQGVCLANGAWVAPGMTGYPTGQ